MSREGKLYRVNAYAVSLNSGVFRLNKELVRDNGWLWRCEGPWDDRRNNRDGYYTFRAVATGSRAPWSEEEMDEVEE